MKNAVAHVLDIPIDPDRASDHEDGTAPVQDKPLHLALRSPVTLNSPQEGKCCLADAVLLIPRGDFLPSDCDGKAPMRTEVGCGIAIPQPMLGHQLDREVVAARRYVRHSQAN